MSYISADIIILILIVVWTFFSISIYNKIVTLSQLCEQAIADINVYLKNRFDLIPNLLETVKWYASHEKWLLNELTEARTKFMYASTSSDSMNADNMLSWTLKSLFAVSENYPDLKANTNFIHLQEELSDLENKIASARRFYNDTVQEYNTYILQFPNNIIAQSLKREVRKWYELTSKEEAVPVSISFNN